MSTNQETIVFRNAMLMVLFYILLGTASFIIAGCAAMMTIYEWFLPKHTSFMTILGGIQWGFGVYCFSLLGWQMCRLGFSSRYQQARLDNRGVDFRLGSKKKPNLQFFGWEEIAAVMHKKQPMKNYFAVVGKDQRSVAFSVFTFNRPTRLARSIAARAGQTIQEF